MKLKSRHEKNSFSFCRGGKKDQRMVTAHLEVSLVFLLIIWARKKAPLVEGPIHSRVQITR